ncbi:MAG: hypothetical protein MZV70_29895 [Desulfobacterales bacterium]|nr:hypothetical protein [Desulfobacterales bacterium]
MPGSPLETRAQVFPLHGGRDGRLHALHLLHHARAQRLLAGDERLDEVEVQAVAGHALHGCAAPRSRAA